MANPAPGFAKHPNHMVRIESAGVRVTVVFADRIVAESDAALVLHETGYPPTYYLPEADLRGELTRPSARRTHCPFKGDASYLSIKVDDRVAEDAIWTYPEPFDECEAIRGHVAFYSDKVDRLEVGS